MVFNLFFCVTLIYFQYRFLLIDYAWLSGNAFGTMQVKYICAVIDQLVDLFKGGVHV